MSSDLIAIAEPLGEVYFIKKEAEAELKQLRENLFDIVTSSFSEDSLAQKTYICDVEWINTEEDAIIRAEMYNSGWVCVDKEIKYGKWHILLREEPSLKQASIVVKVENGVEDVEGNTYPGYVVTKTVRKGADLLDIEALEYNDLDLICGLNQAAIHRDLIKHILQKIGLHICFAIEEI